MVRKLACLGLLIALLAPNGAHADLHVVATVPDLAAIAREIGGSRVDVTSLSLPTQDPHFVDAKPSLTLAVNKADLLLAVGLDLEVGWLPTLQVGARNARVQRGGSGYLECSAYVDLIEVPTGPVDRSMGDIHPGGNPHYLHDPRAAKACARAIADRMAALDPDSARAYRAGLERFERRLAARRAAWEKRMARFRGAPVITYHRSWVYLTDWLGLAVVETLEPKPGIAPSPSHVLKVIQLGRARKVKAVLQESYYPSKTGALVANKLGGTLVRLPAAADFRAGQSYIDRMEALITRLEQALKG
jgi:zinc/manganese transport system substrate-binding protein